MTIIGKLNSITIVYSEEVAKKAVERKLKVIQDKVSPREWQGEIVSLFS